MTPSRWRHGRQLGCRAEAGRISFTPKLGRTAALDCYSTDTYALLVRDTLSVFISYSNDSDERVAWVTQVANVLDASPEFHVVFDQYDIHAGKDLTEFMDRGLACDRVVVVITPAYISKAAARSGGVGYESSVISAELFANQLSGRFVPALREGDERPPFLKSKVYVDFRDDSTFAMRMRELARALRGLAPVQRPNKVTASEVAEQSPPTHSGRVDSALLTDAPLVIPSLAAEAEPREYFEPIHLDNVSDRDAFNVDIGDISNGSQVARFSRVPRLKPRAQVEVIPEIERAESTRNGVPDLYKFAFIGQVGRIHDSIRDGSRNSAKNDHDRALLQNFVAPFKITYIDALGRTWVSYSELILGRDRAGRHRFAIEFRRVEFVQG